MGIMGEWLGIPIPVAPAKGQILGLAAHPVPIKLVIWGENAYLLPRTDGTIVLGATVEHVGFDRRTTADALSWLLAQIPSLCPALTTATFLQAWTGFRPEAPDGLPIIGPAPGWENVTVATAHHRNGIMLAPITAQLVARHVVSGERDPLLQPLLPDRFVNPNRGDVSIEGSIIAAQRANPGIAPYVKRGG